MRQLGRDHSPSTALPLLAHLTQALRAVHAPHRHSRRPQGAPRALQMNVTDMNNAEKQTCRATCAALLPEVRLCLENIVFYSRNVFITLSLVMKNSLVNNGDL